jgi:multidrug efflux pump subunit AcrB
MGRKYRGLIEGAMRNRNIVIIITAVFMMIGVVALKKMPRNEFPQFTIRQGVIVGVYPGATSAEVEAQLTSKKRENLFTIQRRHHVHLCRTKRQCEECRSVLVQTKTWA